MNMDNYCGAFIALLGLALLFLIIPAQVELVESSGLTPQTFPKILAWLLVIAGCVQLVLPSQSEVQVGSEFLRVGVLCAVFAAVIYIASWVKFIYVSPLLALFLMKMMGEKRLIWLGLGVLCTPFCIWLCVDVLLGRELI